MPVVLTRRYAANPETRGNMTESGIANEGNAHITYVSTGDFASSTDFVYEEPKPRVPPALAAALGAVLAVSAVGVATLTTGAGERKDTGNSLNPDTLIILAFALGSVIIVALLAAIPWFITRRTYMKNQNEHFAERIKAERERHSQAMEQLKRTTELATLMGLNQNQIKTYHDIVTEQANKSFRSSRTAMNVGLFLLVAAATGGVYVPI